MPLSVIGRSLCPRPYLAEEGFFPWPRRGSSLDWALGPTCILVWAPQSITPTIAPRDSSFLPHGRKGGSRCDDSPFTSILHCLIVRYSFSLSKSRSCHFGTRGTLSLRSFYEVTQIQWLKTALQNGGDLSRL